AWCESMRWELLNPFSTLLFSSSLPSSSFCLFVVYLPFCPPLVSSPDTLSDPSCCMDIFPPTSLSNTHIFFRVRDLRALALALWRSGVRGHQRDKPGGIPELRVAHAPGGSLHCCHTLAQSSLCTPTII